ncbi:MAG: hypothetical protein K5662_05435 [Lachnospiraceae bacterium]|nr:hypothetical protein [Lachnospiraceae bacterium]
MAVDIKEIVEQIMDKAKKDPKLMDNLKKDPEKTIESLTGIDIPDGMMDKVVAAIKSKETMNKISGIVNMFNKD